ncbi:hypothetical protein IFR05_016928 [Cadophora sp. M221]|nr:hypothetical protein IFR05_016928 [Cadophora sp. M221]
MADSQIPPVTSSPSALIIPPSTKKDRTKTPNLRQASFKPVMFISQTIRNPDHINTKTKKPHCELKDSRKPHELVTLFAGNSPRKFVVHKEFACHYSPVLEVAFNGDFIEGQTQEYKFEDTGEEVIRLMVHWFYTQKLDTIVLGDLHKKGGLENCSSSLMMQARALVELWVLCNRLLIPRLHNAIVHEIVHVAKHTNTIPVSDFKYVYENTAPNSPLRRIYVDQCVTHFRSGHAYTLTADYYLHEMLLDLVIKFNQVLPDLERFRISNTRNMATYLVTEDMEL